jgi:hypothetical protein
MAALPFSTASFALVTSSGDAWPPLSLLLSYQSLVRGIQIMTSQTHELFLQSLNCLLNLDLHTRQDVLGLLECLTLHRD